MVPFNVSSLSSRLGKRDRFHHYVQPRCQKGGRKTRRTDRGKATYMEEYVFLCARRISTHGKSEEEAQKMSFPPSPLSPSPLASLAPGGSILKAICHFLPLPSSRRPFLKFLLHFSLPLLYVFSSYGLLLGLGAAMVRETSYLMLSQVRGIYHERLHKTVHMFFFSSRALVLSKLLLIIIVTFCPIPSTSSGAARPPRCGPLPAPAWGWPYSPTPSARHSGISRRQKNILPSFFASGIELWDVFPFEFLPWLYLWGGPDTRERGGAICILTSYFTSNGGGGRSVVRGRGGIFLLRIFMLSFRTQKIPSE